MLSNLEKEIIKTITDILEEEHPLSLESNPQNTSNWDSLSHAIIISRIEKQYNIKFNLQEMLSLENVKQICELVNEKANN